MFVTATLAVALSAAASGSASADQVRYVGMHPITAGGFCHIEAIHVHVYAPARNKERVKAMYRVHDGNYHFVGDPVAFGYKGPKKTYYGHHPVAIDVVVGDPMPQHHTEFCYLDGPHYHYYEPPADISFVVDGGSYWYAGAYPAVYERERAGYVAVNAVYEPLVYERPVVTVVPPKVYVGPVVAVRGHGRGHGHGAVGVGVGVGVSAGVEVHVPAPRLEVGISLPGVIIVDDDHHHHGKHKHKKHKHKRYKNWKH